MTLSTGAINLIMGGSIRPVSDIPGLDFSLNPEGRRIRPAESCSLSYGLHVRLGLLPTPPRGDAVTSGYQDQVYPGSGLLPLRSRMLPGVRIPASAGM